MKSLFTPNKLIFPYLIGNILDHYDMALYSFLCPLMAPLFFPHQDPWVAIMLSFGVGSFSFISRPLGAFFFGRLIYRQGIAKTLSLSLFGVAVSTASIAFIPDYYSWGILSPFLLLIARFCQGFFAEGESSLTGLYIFEILPLTVHRRFSSHYQASSLLGIILASLTASIITLNSCPEKTWRIAFLIGLAPGIIGSILRSLLPYSPSLSQERMPPLKPIFKQYSDKIVPILIVSGFSYMTYALPFIFLNAFIPAVSPSLSYNQMMISNTELLIFDLVLCIALGKIRLFSLFPPLLMGWSALVLSIVIIPLFYVFNHPTVLTVTVVRMIIIIIGVIFAVPLQEWFFSQIPHKDRYIVIGVASSIGKEVFGRLTPFICWGLWNHTHWLCAPAFYIICMSILTILVLNIPININNCKE